MSLAHCPECHLFLTPEQSCLHIPPAGAPKSLPDCAGGLADSSQADAASAFVAPFHSPRIAAVRDLSTRQIAAFQNGAD